jgi:hypothetical protein
MQKKQWKDDPILGFAKAAIAYISAQYIHEGLSFSEIHTRSRFRKKNIVMTRLGDQLPDFVPTLLSGDSETVTRPNGSRNGVRLYATFDNASNLVASRINAVLNTKELDDFFRPEFSHMNDVLLKLLDNPMKTITNHEIYHIHEKKLLAKYGNGPGLYGRFDPENEIGGYAGESKNITNRNGGHSNAGTRIFYIKATITKSAAKDAEKRFFALLTERYKDKVYYPPGTKGCVKMKNGMPFQIAFHSIMNDYEKEIFGSNIDLRDDAPKLANFKYRPFMDLLRKPKPSLILPSQQELILPSQQELILPSQEICGL